MQSYATDPDVVPWNGTPARRCPQGWWSCRAFHYAHVGSAGTLVSRIADNLAPVVVLIKFGLGVTLGVNLFKHGTTLRFLFLTIRLDIDLVIENSVEFTAGIDEANDQAMVRLYNDLTMSILNLIFVSAEIVPGYDIARRLESS